MGSLGQRNFCFGGAGPPCLRPSVTIAQTGRGDSYLLSIHLLHCVTKKFDISGKHTKLWFLGVVFGAESESAIVFFYHVRFLCYLHFNFSIFQKKFQNSAIM